MVLTYLRYSDTIESMESLISVREAAKLLSVSKSMIYLLTEQRKLPCTRIGSRILFFPSELEKWARAQTSELKQE